MKNETAAAPSHRVVDRESWLKERLALLAEEKAFTRQRDRLAEKVRAMPWVKVDKAYTFDGPSGRNTLSDLFGTRSQLMIYHFMFDPTWSQGCMSCSLIADHYNGLVVHLAHRDISFVTLSKAGVDQIEKFRSRMGWTFPWLSAGGTDFSRDFGVSFTDEELADERTVYNFNRRPYPVREMPGLSVFIKGASGDIYHTYSSFGRGLEDYMSIYRYIDVTPRGRDEAPNAGMAWLRHHDRYEDANFVVPWLEKPGITGPVMR